MMLRGESPEPAFIPESAVISRTELAGLMHESLAAMDGARSHLPDELGGLQSAESLEASSR